MMHLLCFLCVFAVGFCDITVTKVDPKYVFAFRGPSPSGSGEIELSYGGEADDPYIPLKDITWVDVTDTHTMPSGSVIMTGYYPWVNPPIASTTQSYAVVSSEPGINKYVSSCLYKRATLVCTTTNKDFCIGVSTACPNGTDYIYSAQYISSTRSFTFEWTAYTGPAAITLPVYTEVYCAKKFSTQPLYGFYPASAEKLSTHVATNSYFQKLNPIQKEDRVAFANYIETLDKIQEVTKPYDPNVFDLTFQKIKSYFFFIGDSRMNSQRTFVDFKCAPVFGFDIFNKPEFAKGSSQEMSSFVWAQGGKGFDSLMVAGGSDTYMGLPRLIAPDQVIIYYEGVNIAFANIASDVDMDSFYNLFDVVTSSEFLQLKFDLRITGNVLSYACPNAFTFVVIKAAAPCEVICDDKVILKHDQASANIYPLRLTGTCTSTCGVSPTYLCYVPHKPRKTFFIRSSSNEYRYPHSRKFIDGQKAWCDARDYCTYYPAPIVYPSDGIDPLHGSLTVARFTCQAVFDAFLYRTGGLDNIHSVNDRFIYPDTGPYNTKLSVPYLKARPFPEDPSYFDGLPVITLFRVTKNKDFFRTVSKNEERALYVREVCNSMPDYVVSCELTTINEGSVIYDFTLGSSKPFSLAKVGLNDVEIKLEGSLQSIKDLTALDPNVSPPGSCRDYYKEDCEIVYYNNGYGLVAFTYLVQENRRYCYEEFDFTTDLGEMVNCPFPFEVLNEAHRDRLLEIKTNGVPGDHTRDAACFRGICTLGYWASTPNVNYVGQYCCRHMKASESCEITKDVSASVVTLHFVGNNDIFSYTIGKDTNSGIVKGTYDVDIPIKKHGNYPIYVTCGDKRVNFQYTFSRMDFCKDGASFAGYFSVWYCYNYQLAFAASVLGLILMTMIVMPSVYDYFFGILLYFPSRLVAPYCCSTCTCGHRGTCSSCLRASGSRIDFFSHDAHVAANNLGKFIRYVTSSGLLIVIITLLSLTKPALGSEMKEIKVDKNKALDFVETIWNNGELEGFMPSGAYLAFSDKDTYETITYKVSDKTCDSTSCTAKPSFVFFGPFKRGEQWHFKGDNLHVVVKVVDIRVTNKIKKLYKTCATKVTQVPAMTCVDEDCSLCKKEVLLDRFKGTNYYFLQMPKSTSWQCSGSCVALYKGCTCLLCANEPTEDCGYVYETISTQASMTVCMGINGRAFCANITEGVDTDNIISKIYWNLDSKQRFFVRDGLVKTGAINQFGSFSQEFGAIQIVDGKLYGNHDPDPIQWCHFGYERMLSVSRCMVDTYYLHENLEVYPAISFTENSITAVSTESILGEFVIRFPAMVISGGRSTLKLTSLTELQCAGCRGCPMGMICTFAASSPGKGLLPLSSTMCSVAPTQLEFVNGNNDLEFRAFCDPLVEGDTSPNEIEVTVGEHLYTAKVKEVAQVGPVVLDNTGVVHTPGDIALNYMNAFTWKWWYTAIIVVIVLIVSTLVLYFVLNRKKVYTVLSAHKRFVIPPTVRNFRDRIRSNYGRSKFV
ncbi:ORF3 [Macrobrachium rosenbergii Golda virus]|uniref:Envelopment polyprotein n=1 Tax=Macrobrachium rosenbergii Golda virus TaxID=2783683 RepID=A0AAE7NEI7_9NIDO|nr:ORF3 [Macrobrachium rosenbergii Golda virus]QOW03298.1 ORF3 [Macrobrachium rosenbergii Golda virus]